MKPPLLPKTQDTNLGAGKGCSADVICTAAEEDVKFDCLKPVTARDTKKSPESESLPVR
jgi:hypothetical protein